MTRAPQVLSQEQISSINERVNLPAYGRPLTIGLIFVALIIMFIATFFHGIAVFVLGYVYIARVRRKDRARKTTELTYGQTSSRFTAIQSACYKLADTDSVWYIETEQKNSDWKRQAGADNLVTRKIAIIQSVDPPFITTNVNIWGIDVGELKILFFPDAVLVWQHGQYQRVAYESLGIVYYPTRFIDPSPPKDAEIAGYTWQYMNQNGGPDRRFNNNRQIPIALYGLLVIATSAGLKVQLHVSNRSLAADFSQNLANVLNLQNTRQNTSSQGRGKGSGQKKQTRNKSRQKKRETPKSNQSRDVPAHEVLQVPPGATKEQIVAGYRKMARMYHPDKVSGLGPEFKELAEAKMKDINAAYTELLRKSAG